MKPDTLSSYGLSYPPLDGSLFFPEFLEYNSQHNPNHPYFIYPGEDASELYQISHLEFYRACHRVAHVVRPGRQGQNKEVVAILVNCDTILYQALVMGIISAGLIPFPVSPRNSAPAVVDMLRKTKCHRMIVSQHSLSELVSSIRTKLSQREEPFHLQIEESPSLATIYPCLSREVATSPFVPFPTAEQRPEKNDVMFYLHSSGSTGFPKPIPITYLTSNHYCLMPTVTDHLALGKDFRVAAGHLPPFHSMGVLMQLFVPIASLRTVAVYPPTAYHDPSTPPIIANSQITLENIDLTHCNGICAVPAFLEEWVSSPEAVQKLSKLSYVAFAGGPLAKKTGDTLVDAGVKLSSMYGNTECGGFTTLICSPEEVKYWEWIRPGPNTKTRWTPLGDGTYELEVLTSETHQVSVENLPDVKGYATSDVFIKHPIIEGLYKIVGRLDDVLVLSLGEKTVPGPMEAVIGNSRYVAGVCMFGRARPQVGVLIEPRPEFAVDTKDEKRLAEFRNFIWPVIEEANRDAPNFSRIFKEMILVTSTDKPMLRTGKGTVMKKASINHYEPEINALYQSVEASTTAGIEVPLPSEWKPSEVKDWLMVHATMVNSDTPVNPEVDLFEQGFDSLSATFLRNRISGSLKASPIQSIRDVASHISPNVIFSNSTLTGLATYIVNFINGEVSTVDPKAEIERMIEKYSSGLQSPAPKDGDEGHIILMTGSTGGLGSYMLASLLNRNDVVKIYALNRRSKTATAKERQRSSFEDRGLDTSLLESNRLVYIEGETPRHQLGLDQQIYEEMRDSVTVVIHNAWRLDFNLSLTTFEPHVRGTRNLIDLALASKRATKPRFMFISSIASAQSWDMNKGPVPEVVFSDASQAVGGGYGSSKYVSERILSNSGLPFTSFRVGQISGGAPRGAWSTSEWVAILVKSSITLGALPDIRGVNLVQSMAWLPTDAVSGAILDVALGDNQPPTAINLVHPRPVEWEALMKPISKALTAKNITVEPLPLIPAAEWYHRLEIQAVDADEAKIKRVPAIKLLTFFRSFAQGNQHSDGMNGEQGNDANVVVFDFSTEVAERESKTMRELPRLSESDAIRWVDYWESVGFFKDVKVSLA
ncbi:putative aminoadipate reductase [Scleroderma citrinum]